MTNTQICFSIFCHTESHLNWKKGTIGDLLFWAAATWPKITAGVLVDLADLLPDNIRAHEIYFWNVLGGKTGGWLPLVTACVVVYQMSPRLKASMHIIFQSLNFYNHTMLWAACCLGFFGFLHSVEFTVNSHFNPNIAVSDVQAESLVNSGSFRIYIKCSIKDGPLLLRLL